MKKLKPVVFVQGDRQFYRKNEYAQTILLKALSEGVTDPNEMRRLAGLKTVADVYRTLDKLAIRKEYHGALARQGVTLDDIVGGIKKICEESHSDATELKAYQALLRSLGLDKYERQEDSGKSWEETIVKMSEGKEPGESIIDAEYEEYEVNVPEVPEDERKKLDKEKAIGKELYEGN